MIVSVSITLKNIEVMNKKDFEKEKGSENDVGRNDVEAKDMGMKDVETTDLSPYVSEVVEELRRDGKYPAVHIYMSTLHSFTEFSGGRDVEMPMEQVFTPGRLKEYEGWLIVQRGVSLNTVSTYMSTLRAVYNRWMPPGSANHNPRLFHDVHTKVVSQTKRALTRAQVRLLLCADLTGLSREQKVIFAYFMLMFLFRGMPFVDLAHLRKKDMQGDKIVYRRHKTGRQITVRITREAMLLIKEFGDKNPHSVYLFPILNPKLRKGEELYQCYQDSLCHFNRSLKQLMRILLPGVKVSSYTARHTWATLAFHMGTPVAVIGQSLGHSSYKVTETYLKPFENEIVDKVNRDLINYIKKSELKNMAAHSIL